MKNLLSVILITLSLSVFGQIKQASAAESISFTTDIILEQDAGKSWVDNESNKATQEALQTMLDNTYLNSKPLVLNDKVCSGFKHEVTIEKGYKAIYYHDILDNLNNYSREVLESIGYELIVDKGGIKLYRNCFRNTLFTVMLTGSVMINLKIEWEDSTNKSFYGCPIKEARVSDRESGD